MSGNDSDRSELSSTGEEKSSEAFSGVSASAGAGSGSAASIMLDADRVRSTARLTDDENRLLTKSFALLSANPTSEPGEETKSDEAVLLESKEGRANRLLSYPVHVVADAVALIDELACAYQIDALGNRCAYDEEVIVYDSRSPAGDIETLDIENQQGRFQMLALTTLLAATDLLVVSGKINKCDPIPQPLLNLYNEFTVIYSLKPGASADDRNEQLKAFNHKIVRLLSVDKYKQMNPDGTEGVSEANSFQYNSDYSHVKDDLSHARKYVMFHQQQRNIVTLGLAGTFNIIQPVISSPKLASKVKKDDLVAKLYAHHHLAERRVVLPTQILEDELTDALRNTQAVTMGRIVGGDSAVNVVTGRFTKGGSVGDKNLTVSASHYDLLNRESAHFHGDGTRAALIDLMSDTLGREGSRVKGLLALEDARSVLCDHNPLYKDPVVHPTQTSNIGPAVFDALLISDHIPGDVKSFLLEGKVENPDYDAEKDKLSYVSGTNSRVLGGDLAYSHLLQKLEGFPDQNLKKICMAAIAYKALEINKTHPYRIVSTVSHISEINLDLEHLTGTKKPDYDRWQAALLIMMGVDVGIVINAHCKSGKDRTGYLLLLAYTLNQQYAKEQNFFGVGQAAATRLDSSIQEAIRLGHVQSNGSDFAQLGNQCVMNEEAKIKGGACLSNSICPSVVKYFDQFASKSAAENRKKVRTGSSRTGRILEKLRGSEMLLPSPDIAGPTGASLESTVYGESPAPTPPSSPELPFQELHGKAPDSPEPDELERKR